MKNLLLTFLAAALWLGCPGDSQPADDAQHGFDHTVALSTCSQEARLAASKADENMPADAGADATRHAMRYAALDAFDRCVENMKDGGK